MSTQNIFYSIVNGAEWSGATVVAGSEVFTVGSDNPTWKQIVEFLHSGSTDIEALKGLISPAAVLSDRFEKLSERVAVKGGVILFDGDPVSGVLADHIVRVLTEENESGKNDKGYLAFVNFLEKLQTNPSEVSREHLFHFIQSHGITITDDGDFIAYKGTKADGTSINRGVGIVDGVEYENAHLPNAVGSVVEIPRSLVDDNRDRHCSTGLHAGTYKYAKDFAQGLLLNVKINPRDVVSVPSDYNNAKLRVSRYEVLEVTEQEILSATYSYDNSEDEDWLDEEDSDEDFDVRDSDVLDPEEAKIEAFKTLITSVLVPDGVALRRYKGKRITAANRPLFEEALQELGL